MGVKPSPPSWSGTCVLIEVCVGVVLALISSRISNWKPNQVQAASGGPWSMPPGQEVRNQLLKHSRLAQTACACTHSNGGCWHYSLLSAPRPPPPNPLQGHQAEGDRGKITPSLMTWSQFLGPAWQKTNRLPSQKFSSLPLIFIHTLWHTHAHRNKRTHIYSRVCIFKKLILQRVPLITALSRQRQADL